MGRDSFDIILHRRFWLPETHFFNGVGEACPECDEKLTSHGIAGKGPRPGAGLEGGLWVLSTRVQCSDPTCTYESDSLQLAEERNTDFPFVVAGKTKILTRSLDDRLYTKSFRDLAREVELGSKRQYVRQMRRHLHEREALRRAGKELPTELSFGEMEPSDGQGDKSLDLAPRSNDGRHVSVSLRRVSRQVEKLLGERPSAAFRDTVRLKYLACFL